MSTPPPVLTAAPDWGQPVRETLGWLTDVIRALGGAVQTRELRPTPRREFAFRLLGGAQVRQQIDAMLAGSVDVLLPIWYDAQPAPGLSAGATHVPCITAGYDFAAGRYAALIRTDGSHVLLQVDQVLSDRITLQAPLPNPWAAGGRLLPLRAGHLQATTLGTLSGAVASADVQVTIDEPCAWPAALPPTVYLGLPVLEHWRHEGDNPGYAFSRLLQVLSNQTAPDYRLDLADRTWAEQDHAWRVHGRAEHDALRRLLYALRGRAQAVWVPSQMLDLSLAAPVPAGATTLTVHACGYTARTPLQPGRRHVRILLADGTAWHREIIGAAEAGESEVLTLDAPLPSAIAIAAVRAISFMDTMALDADAVELVHVTDADGVTTCAARFAARDVAATEGQEVELYQFARQGQTWCYASAQNPAASGWGFEYASKVYAPAAISRTAVQVGGDGGRSDKVTITLPRTLAVAGNWRPFPPADMIAITVFRWKVGQPTADMVWTGRVVQPKWSDTTLTLTTESTMTLTRSAAPAPRLQGSCWKTLYGPDCKVNPAAHRVAGTIGAINGFTLTIAAAAGFPDGRLVNGVLEWTRADGIAEVRTIVAHAGSSVTVDYGTDTWSVGLAVSLLPGCRQSYDDCAGYFNNSINCGALEYIPKRNPHDGNPVR